MTKKNYSKYEAKEELVTLSFNHVLLHKKDTKIYQVIFLSLLNTSIKWCNFSRDFKARKKTHAKYRLRDLINLKFDVWDNHDLLPFLLQPLWILIRKIYWA